MNRAGSVGLTGTVILAASVSMLHGQAINPSVEQQLRSQYLLTRVGSNGMVVGQPGSVLVIQEDGLTAIPTFFGKYWYNTCNKAGRIKANLIQHVGTAYNEAAAARRVLQVSEKAYLTNLEFAPNEVVFYLQSCGACDPAAVDPNDTPFRSRLAFQFDKGYLSTADARQVLGVTGRVFVVNSSPPSQQSQEPPPSPALPVPAAAPDAQGAPEIGVLNNQDIIKMMKAGFDDTIIIAKISVSKCQFDISTDGLIKLKENGVSAAVLKAMVGAAK
jgi:hypothetical protein